MKKRGATIKHKAASMPGALAMSICPEYETRLRLAVNALSDGWMEEGQFNDLADTIDMLQIGMASYSKSSHDLVDPISKPGKDFALWRSRKNRRLRNMRCNQAQKIEARVLTVGGNDKFDFLSVAAHIKRISRA